MTTRTALVAVKAPVFSMSKLIGVDTFLGPEMKSTGEVMGIDSDFAHAFAQSQLGSGTLPTAGTVRFRSRDLTRATEDELTRYRREEVGFVFQFYNLIPSLTARENVALVTDISERPLPAEEALALVGLGARMDHFPVQMSGGEQQRVAIARAIAKRPDVLLFRASLGELPCACLTPFAVPSVPRTYSLTSRKQPFCWRQ